MKSKSRKFSKKIEEKIKKEKQHAAIIDWFVRIIVATTLKEFYEKNEAKDQI
ncbi:hypothetical protein SGQ83_00105 [Flavobacterium sp. Fl-318]|uniref:Uncharacterized protein n=1 Tax=Flavobacterium cupriresistens TaxID=2893885 RepID=A0ABU4R584_9FLAO|nr:MULTISPECIES: hypothetical protein [unclassified Flavobacterium]MDX6187739.1 hypothetical protein [Flavobacterium sp. Fl-318]UFH42338.1 hypothetical protein LNP23_21345 [Flavobacterium sp. F-323]